jgi:DUF1680 family protein
MKRLTSLPLKTIKIKDYIWEPYISLVKREIIPYQWDALNDKLPDTVPSHCIRNFRIAAGEEEGKFEGAVFQDSDVAKWLEAVACTLETDPDPELMALADSTIDLIGRAQEADGYLDTYFTLNAPELKWTNLKEGHELYVAGHMIEAAVAYTKATGKTAFLSIVRKLADLIVRTFGPEEGKLHGYPGHEEIELALVRLYQITDERSYLDLAKYFIDQRGQGENYFIEEEKQELFKPIWAEPGNYDPSYSQSHLPVREQKTAEGHAVRAVYLYSAMADLAYAYKDKELMDACTVLWEDMTKRRMYVTGSIGSSGIEERFTTDYDLPNDGNYSESCASVGLALFAKRMAEITRDASYMDIAERALYNTVLAGIASDGRSFFYVNPMEIWPENCLPNTSREHVKAVRQKWFGVACCPPNIARTLASLGQYLAFDDQDEKTLYINLYIGSEIQTSFGENTIRMQMEGRFPETGSMKIHIETDDDFDLCLRVPDYAKSFRVMRNGREEDAETVLGYLQIKGISGTEELDILADIPAEFVHAHPSVRADEGKVALVKGPLVYCLEEMDNFPNLASVFVREDEEIEEQKGIETKGLMKLLFKGKAISSEGWDDHTLYQKQSVVFKDVSLTAVPYFSWGNRTPGEMTVWIKELLS